MIGQALRRGINAHRSGPPPTTPLFVTEVHIRSTGATSNILGAMTGVQIGDILIAFAGGSVQNTAVTPPAGLGWTQLADSGAGNSRMFVLATTATSADQAGGTFNWAGSTDTHQVSIVAYRNVALPTTNVGTAHSTSAATTIDAPTLTTVGAGAILLTSAYWQNNGTARTWSGSMTERVAQNSASGAGNVEEEVRATAGATGTRTFTPGGSASAMSAASIILEAA